MGMDGISPIVRDEDDKRPLYVLVHGQLFNLIESNYFKKGDKLPGENILAKQLGVSRGSLRQALLILQEDGIINNIQGKGNYVAKSRKNIGPGLERLSCVARTFNNKEYEDIAIKVRYEVPSKWLQGTLQIDSSVIVVVIHRTYKIDGENTCYSISFIPYTRVSKYNLDFNKTDELLEFIDKDIYEDVSSARTQIHLTTSGDFMAKKLNISENQPLFLLEETIFMEMGKPIVFSKSYFRPEFYDFHINRRRYSTP